MDGSLASIFMNSAATEPWPQAQRDEESPEDLKYSLMCAAMELQNTKATAKAGEEIQEAKLFQLQELVSIIKKERDDAREECRKLQECLSQRQGTLSTDSPCSFMHSSSMVSSPSSSPWSLQELEHHLNSDNFCDFTKASAPMELQQTLQSFSESCNDGLEALFSIEPSCESVLDDSEQQFSLEVLEQDLSFDTDPSLNLGELEEDEYGVDMCEPTQLTRSLSRQSSASSSSASVQMFQRRASIDLTEVSEPVISPVAVISTDAQISGGVPYASPHDNNAAAVMGNSPLTPPPSPPPPPPPESKPISAGPPCTESSLGAAATLCNMPTYVGSPTSKQHANSKHVRQVHLPEPPEADPQVMLSSLPEKGKLLQAVMQAGPLLQTLLLAGPLPQWRHPPPVLSTGDIPKVSMIPSNVFLPYISHVPGPSMQGHVKYRMPMQRGGSSPVRRVRVASVDPCSRTKKLRKLSPASPHRNRLMHMMSGEGMIAVRVPNPPTIY